MIIIIIILYYDATMRRWMMIEVPFRARVSSSSGKRIVFPWRKEA